jgi:hypothetical protein
MTTKTLGWRCWFDDGEIVEGSTFDDWITLAARRPTHLLIKIIYYDNGGKQIQTADWYYEVLHAKGSIRATCNDANKEKIERAAEDAVFIEGFWTVDDWFYEVRDQAMSSIYGN